jgi:hypothetical protein
MEGLKRKIEEESLSKKDIDTLKHVLTRKQYKLEADERQRKVEALRDEPYIIIPEVVQSTKAVLEQYEKDGDLEESWKNVLDDDLIWDAMEEGKCPITTPSMFVEVQEDRIQCESDECWYLHMNPDRIEEHKYNYYHAGELFPKKVYCDVCIDSMDKDTEQDLLEDERPWIIKALRKELKKL